MISEESSKDDEVNEVTPVKHQAGNLKRGTVIDGRYEVLDCLGVGSVAMVYKCRHRDLADHIVAMKVLLPGVASDKRLAARFRKEIISSYLL